MAGNGRRTAAFTALWKALLANREGPSIGTRMAAVPRLVWHTVMGRYDGAARLLMIFGGLIYVVSPIDLLPEALLLIPGLIDDAFVFAWLVGAILSETERFLQWEAGRVPPVVIDGDIA
jgi:uncharacterized membrane protein YkvA (DUF1232 family)